MNECPYCVDKEGFAIELERVGIVFIFHLSKDWRRDGFAIELERVGIEEIERTGEWRYVCPECGYEVWE